MAQTEIILGKVSRPAYEDAVSAGYTGTEAEFYAALVSLKDAPFLPLKGGKMSGNLDFSRGAYLQFSDVSGNGGTSVYDESESERSPVLSFYGIYGDEPVKLRNISSPSLDLEAANKQYVDKVGIPVGGIIIWSGSSSNIPSGWRLCDGLEGTPDLRDRFVVGAGGNSYHVGDTGGEAAHTLTTAELPSHSHGSGTLTTNNAGEHRHTYTCNYGETSSVSGVGGPSSTNPANEGNPTSYDGIHTHAISGSTAAAGSGAAHNNLPPYYALCYIMRIS